MDANASGVQRWGADHFQLKPRLHEAERQTTARWVGEGTFRIKAPRWDFQSMFKVKCLLWLHITISSKHTGPHGPRFTLSGPEVASGHRRWQLAPRVICTCHHGGGSPTRSGWGRALRGGNQHFLSSSCGRNFPAAEHTAPHLNFSINPTNRGEAFEITGNFP